MDTWSAPDLARAANLSLPTVHRALDRAGVPRVSRGRSRTFPAQAAERIMAEQGVTPVSELSRSQLKVLYALLWSVEGLPSARAVAVRAGVSPTTASRALRTLTVAGYVTDEPTSSGGRTLRVEQKRWPSSVRAAVRSMRPPAIRRDFGPLPHDLRRLVHADVTDPRRDGIRFADALLATADERAWSWVLTNVSRDYILATLRRRHVPGRLRQFINRWWALEDAAASNL